MLRSVAPCGVAPDSVVLCSVAVRSAVLRSAAARSVCMTSHALSGMRPWSFGSLSTFLPLDHRVPVADQQAMPVVHATHCAAAGAIAALELDVSADVVEQPGRPACAETAARHRVAACSDLLCAPSSQANSVGT